MAKSRPEKTLADYVAIAISPALIMVLVGSLVFFLLDVAYSGELSGRFRWILFWFVFAAVLIARIGIEEGNEYAAVYIVAFWGAVSLVLFRFLESQVFLGYALLGVVWWCAKKLTWDCTLIDDDQDASGQGLLQITGLDPGDEPEGPKTNGTADEEKSKPMPAENDPKSESLPEEEEDPKKRPHAPGLWVVYFSLAALPLFGLGQLFIPAADQVRRTSAFRYLWFYVAAGLGLLLTTSFLGLRRYLRQRKLSMPGKMTGQWIASGALLAVGILLVCLILPRPNATYSMTGLVDKVSEKIGKASEYALGSNDAGKGEGRRAGRAAKDEEAQQNGEGKKGNDGSQAGETSKTGQQASGDGGKKDGSSQTKGGDQKQSGDDKNSKAGGESSSDQKTGEQNNPEQNEEGQKTQNEPGGGRSSSDRQTKEGSSQKPGGSSSAGSKIATFVKWLIYLAIIVVAVIFAIRHWDTIKAGLARFLQDLKDLFAALFGRKPQEDKGNAMDGESLLKDRPIKPFAHYANPFRTGMDRDMGTIELIAYTYDALQAWGAEHGCRKRPDQTPTEYVQQIAMSDARLGAEARQVALLYLRAAFSTTPPTSECHAQLKKAWKSLESAGALAT